MTTASAYVLAWLVLTVPLAAVVFLTSQTSTTVASHDAVVRPTIDGYVTLRTGPFLPDVRMASERRLGVDISLGKTEAGSAEQLVQRYAFIASQPDGQVAQVEGSLTSLAYRAALRAGLVAVLPLGVWAAIGDRRRRELAAGVRTRRGMTVVAAGTALVVAGGLLVAASWESDREMLADDSAWFPLGEYLPEVDVPAEAQDIEVAASATTRGTKRLILSAVDTYQRSRTFYSGARERAAELELRQPEEGETVALLVADRHDNIGMDPVSRAIADRAGATAVLDAGDDTSTGAAWEAFSLDSLDDAYADYGDQRYSVAGNHDNGTFVDAYLRDRGWRTATGEPVEGPGGSVLLAINDPRSSGLGTWRDEPELSFGDASERLADEACAAPDRVNTLLVHDANLGEPALERGCVDLVVGGHLHVQEGPDPVVGENGVTGFSYTNGTSGGAAYAIAVGSKLRRPAEVSLVTYRDGRPVGIQSVLLQTNGVFDVGDYVELDYGDVTAEDPDSGTDADTGPGLDGPDPDPDADVDPETGTDAGPGGEGSSPGEG
ncbi:metallophosphoesterase [Nocardioides donggukensis]|uniref:Metallophosphoesterase n=1 Tax=Nocardioides donggukensis TaxID=2774019 RepID=A0A927K5T2_9ACTN|nr:metallophosphoesterase [Nocardioides donggukensis]MBD8868376.1 metallophosphoesterase [Nocardioides donggukensis]